MGISYLMNHLLDLYCGSYEFFSQIAFGALTSVYVFPGWREYVVGTEPEQLEQIRREIDAQNRESEDDYALISSSPEDKNYIKTNEDYKKYQKRIVILGRWYHRIVREITNRCGKCCKLCLYFLVFLMATSLTKYVGVFVLLLLLPLLYAKKQIEKKKQELQTNIEISRNSYQLIRLDCHKQCDQSAASAFSEIESSSRE